MSPRIARALLSVAASGVVGLSALSAPAQADVAGGGNYAASIATVTKGNGVQTGKNVIQLRAYIASTSSVVQKLHGTLTLSMYRVQSGGLVARRQLPVNSESSTQFTAHTIAVTIGSTIPRGSRSSYYVVGVFHPTSGHIEKSSAGTAGSFHIY